MSDSKRGGISVAELTRRGWTRRLIQQLLGDPDSVVPNPHHPSGTDMRLYVRRRMEAAERGEVFQHESPDTAGHPNLRRQDRRKGELRLPSWMNAMPST
jgi:hypothetical protein